MSEPETAAGGSTPSFDHTSQLVDRINSRRSRYTAHDDARVEVADGVRALIREVADTNAPLEVLHSVAALVDEAVRLLETAPHGRRYVGSAEGALGGASDLTFADFSPFVGPMSPLAPPIDARVVGEVVRAEVVYRLPYEGPPGHVHGGFIAAGFDEVLGFAQGLSGKGGMTGRLEVSYRSPTPLNQTVVYEAGIVSVIGRKVTCWGTLRHGETLCAEATGLFIAFDANRLDRLMAAREGGASADPSAQPGEHGE